jgi:CIC family chloride channel protein
MFPNLHLKPRNATFLTALIRFLRPSENTLLLAMAIIVGVATALALWGFRSAIETFHEIFIEKLAHDVLHSVGDFGPVIALTLAGLIVGWIVHRFIGHERYHGVAGIMEAVALSGGRLAYKTMPFKALASALSLGAGASVGPEDPSVQIGANLGSFLGQRLHVNEEQLRLLVSAGAASAISSAFNAPIAGVFFALEVVLHGELATASVSVVILSAVISTALTQGLGIGETAMGPFNFTLNSALEIPYFIPLGLLLAPVAALFIKGAYWQQDIWHQAVNLPQPYKTALAGAMVGIAGIFLPEILGGGREVMNEVLRGEQDFVVTMLIALGVVKMLMTTISLAAGFVGGIFAPSLFVGIMLGEAYGRIINDVFGSSTGDPRAFAIAGMAGMMAGVVRAPITAIMLVFELTNDYRFILPIMLVSVLCIYVAERIQKFGVYELSLVRMGINLRHGRDIDVMQGVTVGEAMCTPPPTIHKEASLTELRDKLRQLHRHALCVVNNDNKLIGIVTLSDLQEGFIRAQNDGVALMVEDICTKDALVAYPDDVLWTAIRNMGSRGVGRLPVVDPRTDELVGMVNRNDVVNAYNTAIQRKLKDQQIAEQVRLNTLTGAHVYEMYVKPESTLAEHAIKDITWPPEAVVASIQRKGKLIVPHGTTVLRAGDVLNIVADPHAEFALIKLFKQETPIV